MFPHSDPGTLTLERPDQLLLLSQKIGKLKSASAAKPEHVERFRTRLKEAEWLSLPLKDTLLKMLSEPDDLIDTEETEVRNDKRHQNETKGRIMLGSAILIAVVALQIVSDFHLKFIIFMQLVGLMVALCL